MMKPVIRALRECGAFGFIMVARLEWIKFKSESLEKIRSEYEKYKDEKFTRLHLDHIPVIDEDNGNVEYLKIIDSALSVGYDSVMIDGSRLPLERNISAVKEITALAHSKSVPVEAELGAVFGHEAGPLPPYEELFTSGRGFTSVEEAAQFCRETDVDWLSVAVGNIHGAVSAAHKDKDKFPARLDQNRIKSIFDAVSRPLVLHGGTGISSSQIQSAVCNGIAKINVATAIRQPYEKAVMQSQAQADEAVFLTVMDILQNELKVQGSAEKLISSGTH